MKRKVVVYAVLFCIIMLQGCALDFWGNGSGQKDPIESNEPYNASIWRGGFCDGSEYAR